MTARFAGALSHDLAALRGGSTAPGADPLAELFDGLSSGFRPQTVAGLGNRADWRRWSSREGGRGDRARAQHVLDPMSSRQLFVPIQIGATWSSMV